MSVYGSSPEIFVSLGVLEKISFAYWLQAMCGNGGTKRGKNIFAEEHEAGLKNRGFFPLDNGWPELHHWWPGPINLVITSSGDRQFLRRAA